MKFLNKWALALLPGLALAMPAMALPPAGQADLMQPGSVLIFPKFLNLSAVTVDGVSMPRTEIEIGAVCPAGATCTEHQTVKVRLHWVCPATEGVNSNICRETDFDLVLSIDGKLAFPADGAAPGTYWVNAQSVPAPPCPRGYLIAWVVNTNDLPIRFDGLIGNAVIRNPNIVDVVGTRSTGLSSYSALGIQAAAPGAAAPLIDTTAAGGLIFDGAAGHYTEITGQFAGDLRFDKTVTGAPLPNVLSKTYITFLTLDVRSNQPNNPTIVPLQFWNESAAGVSSTNPAFERLISSSWEFVCWDQVNLASDTTAGLCGLGTGCIDTNLTQASYTTRKGIVRVGPGPAMKFADGNAPGDDVGAVTLLGLIETIEGTAPNSFLERKYNFNVNVIGPPVATTFIPFPASVP